MVEIILQYVDAPAVALFAIYLYRQSRRYQGKVEDLREEIDRLHKRHTNYIKEQAKLWREVSKDLREAKKRLKEQNGNSESA